MQKIRLKLSKFSYALRETKKTTDMETALVMYYAYAHAWLTYGVILWGNSTEAPALFILQKKLIRILVNIQDIDSCKPHFKNLKILTLPSLYILEICKFVRKYPGFFQKREDITTQYRLRHKKKLILPTSKLALFSSGPLVMSIKVYNNLPIYMRGERKDFVFIKQVKQMLIDKAYYSVQEFLSDKFN